MITTTQFVPNSNEESVKYRFWVSEVALRCQVGFDMSFWSVNARGSVSHKEVNSFGKKIFERSAFSSRRHARALAAGLPPQDLVSTTTDGCFVTKKC